MMSCYVRVLTEADIDRLLADKAKLQEENEKLKRQIKALKKQLPIPVQGYVRNG